MKTLFFVLSLALALGNVNADEAGDRDTYARLKKELAEIDRDFVQTRTKALTEMKEAEDGKPSPATAARLLELRRLRDLAANRILVLAARHGWAAPSFDLPSPEEPDATPRERLEGEVLRLLDTAIARDARRIAQFAPLPLIPRPVDNSPDNQK